MDQSTFAVNRINFLDALKAIRKISPKLFNSGVAKINVLPEHIELHVVGITKYLKARTENYFDVYIPLRFLYSYASTLKLEELSFTVSKGQLQCGISTVSSPEIYIRDIFHASDDNMPINFDDFDLLKYASATPEEELIRIHLAMKVLKAKSRMKSNLTEALQQLKQYRITYEDLEKLITQKFTP